MQINQEDLIDVLFRVGCFKIEETRLKSGSISPIHIDLPMVNGSPKVLRNLATDLYSKICDLKFDLICGVSFTSLPLVVVSFPLLPATVASLSLLIHQLDDPF